MDHVTVCEAEVATQWLCVWMELRSTGWSVPVSACVGVFVVQGAALDSLYIWFLETTNSVLAY